MSELFQGYFYCNITKRIIIFFAFSVPNITDLVLSIITYDNELKKYYILRFITQGICFIYSIFIISFFTYQPAHQRLTITVEELCLICIFLLILLFFIPMEITCLVYFIIDFNSLETIGKLAYFIHLITVPSTVFFILWAKKNRQNILL